MEVTPLDVMKNKLDLLRQRARASVPPEQRGEYDRRMRALRKRHHSERRWYIESRRSYLAQAAHYRHLGRLDDLRRYQEALVGIRRGYWGEP